MAIAPTPLQSILAATNLKDGSDAVLKSAAILAARTGAELHVLHVLEPERRFSLAGEGREDAESRLKHAGDLLEELLRRTVPSDVVVKSMKVENFPAVHATILRRAEEVSAGLIVFGPQSGGSSRSHFLGTTADRVLVMTGIPCLVVDEVIADPIERIGVPVDFSKPSGVALLAALSVGVNLSGGVEGKPASSPRIQVMNVGWTVERVDDPDLEERELKPRLIEQVERALSRHPDAKALEIDTEVLWGYDSAEKITGWVRRDDIDLLVMGTHGRTGFRRAILGSVATRIARQTPCPVLLVPPSYGGGWAREPALDRVMITTDFHDTDTRTARWCVRSLAPEAQHMIFHVLAVPELPLRDPDNLPHDLPWRDEVVQTSLDSAHDRLEELKTVVGDSTPGASGSVETMTAEGRPAAEIVREAEEADMDLIVMGGYRHDERKLSGRTISSTTVERVLRSTCTPVFIVRGRAEQPPQSVLVAVDGSEPSLRAVAWADFLRRRFDASCTAIFVESPALFGFSDTISGSFDVSESAVATARGEVGIQTPGWAQGAAKWIRTVMRRAGVNPDDFRLRVAAGRPAEEILVEQERSGADLIVLGTHGRGTGLSAIIGSVAGAVIRDASCSVLAVGDPTRAGG